MSEGKLNCIRPVEVPWMVSPSLSSLKLECDSTQSDKYSFVRLEAFFGHKVSKVKDQSEYQKVVIIFIYCLAAYYYPEFFAKEHARLENYNWDDVPEFRDRTGDFSGSDDRFNAEWEKTSVCPDPAMYEVANSQLLKELELHIHGYRHFLILGGDNNVEVIAKDYRWESEGAVE